MIYVILIIEELIHFVELTHVNIHSILKQSNYGTTYPYELLIPLIYKFSEPFTYVYSISFFDLYN